MLISKPMGILKPVLKKELAKFIAEKFPVTRKRSAFWFFTNEFKNDLVENSSASSIRQATSIRISKNDNQSDSSEPVVKVSRNRILRLWKNMDPESKRKYFNMAEFDELRFQEQKSLWLSEVGSLLHKHRNMDRVKDLAPTHDSLQNEFLESLDKLHKNYEQMIQTESTKTLYKDAIRRVDLFNPSLATTDLISALPKHHKQILSKPRRPATPYTMYTMDNMARYLGIRRETGTKESHFQMSSREWMKMSRDDRQVYEERYAKLKKEYDKAMEQYKLSLNESSDQYLETASREKKLFRKSLRRRLRNSSVLPLSIRNPFNFFAMEQKDGKLTHLTETWRSMTPEQKQIYYKMNEEDAARYKAEVEVYYDIKKSLSDMLTKSRRKSDLNVDAEDESVQNDVESTSSDLSSESGSK